MAALPQPGAGGGYASPRSGRRLPAIAQILQRLSRPEQVDEAAHRVATEAVQGAHALAARASEDPQQAIQELARAARLARVGVRLREDALHEALGHVARGIAPYSTEPLIAGATAAWRSFVTEFHAEPVWPDVVVFNESAEYAGRVDGFVRIGGHLLVAHYHLSEAELPVIPFAVAATSRADYAVTPDGAQIDAPSVAGAVAVQLDASGRFKARPVHATEEHWRAFLGLRAAHLAQCRKDAINGPVRPTALMRALQRPRGTGAEAHRGPEL